jgi:hypothetical protein
MRNACELEVFFKKGSLQFRAGTEHVSMFSKPQTRFNAANIKSTILDSSNISHLKSHAFTQ